MRNRIRLQRLSIPSFAALMGVAAAACTGVISGNGGNGASSSGGAGDDGGTTYAFEAVQPRTYVAKIKNLLTGLPPTQSEIDGVVTDPTTLPASIESWIAMPQGEASIFSFFQSSFQQVQVGSSDFADQLGSSQDFAGGTGNPDGSMLLEGFQESFARTAWELVMVEGQPFNSLFTTQTYMMTSAMVVSLLYFERNTASNGPASIYDQLYANELSGMVITDQGGPIPIEQTLDPTSPNYLHWYTGGAQLICGPTNLSSSSMGAMSYTNALYNLFLGQWNVFGSKAVPAVTADASCLPTTPPALLLPSDYTDWHMVTFRALNSGEQPMRMWDLHTIRAANSTTPIPLRTQRIGPFTTPAFFANWPSNTSNLSRATLNQTLIVSLGASFDGSNVIVQSGLTTNDNQATSDSEHTNNPACVTCHGTLDPLRQFFTQTYSTTYDVQTSTSAQNLYGIFDFGGVTTNGSSLYDLGKILSTHPMLPAAWVQKLCYWANSSPCSVDDPVFTGLATSFQSGNYNFKNLLRDFLASPLVTGAQSTKTQTDNGEVLSISRLDHFCTALDNRLGLTNACTLNSTASAVSLSIPTDSYTRGATEPFQPADPSLFFRAAVENLCIQVASVVVDVSTGPSLYSSGDPQDATASMATNVMALQPDDARYPEALQILRDHYASALAAGQNATNALKSTFTLACTSPSSVTIGL